MENIFGCSSAEEINIPENGSDFFKPEDGNTKIRFLAGPIVYFESQEFGEDKKPVGDKKFYAYEDTRVKSDKFTKVTFSYIIYDYSDGNVKQWNIATRNLQKTIQTLNSLNPDLSLMDCVLSKSKGSNGFNEYKLASGQSAPFVKQDVIDLFKKDNPFIKLKNWINEKIKETDLLLKSQKHDEDFEAQVVEAQKGKTIEENQQATAEAKANSDEVEESEAKKIFTSTETME